MSLMEEAMKEKSIENSIKSYLKTVPCLFYWKEHGGMYGTAGIPDLIICYRGRFIALEVKTEIGKPTVLQVMTIKKIKDAGGISTVVRGVAEVKIIIDAVTDNKDVDNEKITELLAIQRFK